MKTRMSPHLRFILATLAFLSSVPGLAIEQQAYVKGANSGAGDQFGTAVAVSGDTLVIGAPREDSGSTGVNRAPNENAADSGAVYVFLREGTTWTQQAYLKPAAVGVTQAGDQFGTSVAISGDTLVVGAISEDGSATGVNGAPDENASNAGAAYVFVRNGGTWTQQAYLKPAAVGASQSNDQFGFAVAIHGNTIVVGAIGEASASTGVNSSADDKAPSAGAAYVFTREGETWTQQAYLKSAAVGTTQQSDQFGSAVAIDGDTVVVGALNEDSASTGVNSTPSESALSAGAAYVFTRNGTTWTQQAYLKPAAVGATQQFDLFGISVAISGETVVVGAHSESSGTTGVNSVPNDGSTWAGAAYVFTRNGTTWTEQAYLKPASFGSTQERDLFGRSVAIAGNMIAVGAYQEDGGGAGVNPAADENAKDAGAVYIFRREGAAWTQQAYLKPSAVGVTQAGDQFGRSAAISGDTLVIGALLEDGGATGVNAAPDESASDAGAAYVFTGLGPPLTPLQAWRRTHFGITENLGDAANGFDFDHDGVPNLLEYGLATHPKDGQAFPLTPSIARREGDRFLLTTFPRDPAHNDVTLRVETAGDLAGPWETVASSVNGAAMTGPGLVGETDMAGGLKQMEVRDTVPSASAARRFLRITVQE